MKITNIFEGVVRDEVDLYDPRHLFEDFKRTQSAIMEAEASARAGKQTKQPVDKGVTMADMDDEDVSSVKSQAKLDKEAEEQRLADDEKRRAEISPYQAGEGAVPKDVRGDQHISSAFKSWRGRTSADGDYDVEITDPGQEELEDVDSASGLEAERGARAKSSGGDYVRKFQKQRTAHAKERGVPQIRQGASDEDKQEINHLATLAKKKQKDSFQKDGEAVAKAANTGKDISAETDSQAMTDLYDASLQFLISASSKVLSRAGLTGQRQTSLLDDAFQEASALWFDAVKKYKLSDGDFENFMRSNVSRGIRNWATTELQGGAPTSMRSSREGSRLNKIKGQLQQQGVPEENMLSMAAEVWNQEENEKVAKAAEEGKEYSPRIMDEAKLRKIEVANSGWGSTDDTIEGEEGEVGTVGSQVEGGDSGEIFGQSGASASGSIGTGASPEEDIERIERETQSGGSDEGLAKLGDLMTQAGIGDEDMEIFSALWGLGGEAPMGESEVAREYDVPLAAIRKSRKNSTKALVRTLTDQGWDELEIRNFLEDVFDERQQLHNLATKPGFEQSKKKDGGDVLTPEYKQSMSKLKSMRDKRVQKKGPKRAAERAAQKDPQKFAKGQTKIDQTGNEVELPSSEWKASKEGTTDVGVGTPSWTKQRMVGAENYKILQKRYSQVEKALGRLGDDATEEDIDKWYKKANTYLGNTYGLDPKAGGEGPLTKEVVDTASQEFKDRITQVRDDKIAELAKMKSEQIGKDLSPEEYLERRTASLARKGDNKKTVDKNEGKRGTLDYKPFKAKDAKKQGFKSAEDHPDYGKRGIDMKKDRRIKSYMDALGLSHDEAEKYFNKKFPDHQEAPKQTEKKEDKE
ncbi:coil containing protein [Vibrio phage 2.275.O._10N.286.54.E11]|nr:coil containing protein [Vibrio phage 2.275.O._10N.286.54.E11]